MAIDKKLIDQLLADYKKPEDIIGENGLLKELTKAILERALEAEMTDHLGYEKHDPAGQLPLQGFLAFPVTRVPSPSVGLSSTREGAKFWLQVSGGWSRFSRRHILPSDFLTG